MMFISHDLSVVAYIADRVAVMYLGRIVELGASESLFSSPSHPYTRALLEAAPEIGKRMGKKPQPAKGEAASSGNIPHGCPFHPRCPNVQDICRIERPQLGPIDAVANGHITACHFANPV